MDNPLVKMAAPTMVLLSTHLTKPSPTDKKDAAMGSEYLCLIDFSSQQVTSAPCLWLLPASPEGL